MATNLSRSYLTAALQLHADARLVARYTMESAVEDVAPLTVSDAQAFIDMAFEVRNAAFSLPSVMTYSKFSMVLNSMITMSGSPGLYALNPFEEIDNDMRYSLLRDISREYTAWCEQILIISVRTSGRDLLNLPLTGTNKPRFTQHVWNPKMSYPLEICVRNYDITDLTNEDERDFWLRQVVSRSLSLSEKSSILLSDASIPLSIVPGCNNRMTLRRLANEITTSLNYGL